MLYNLIEIIGLIFRFLGKYWHFILFIWVCIYATHLTIKIEQNLNIKIEDNNN
jgi:hypothetical protein